MALKEVDLQVLNKVCRCVEVTGCRAWVCRRHQHRHGFLFLLILQSNKSSWLFHNCNMNSAGRAVNAVLWRKRFAYLLHQSLQACTPSCFTSICSYMGIFLSSARSRCIQFLNTPLLPVPTPQISLPVPFITHTFTLLLTLVSRGPRRELLWRK